MSKFNLSVYLNAYGDPNASNNPSQSNFKWNREVGPLVVGNPVSQTAVLAPGETRSLFSGVRTTAQDNTTQYSIVLAPFSSSTYQLSAVAGTLPNFRTPRNLQIDGTTQITVTLNGPVATFADTGGAEMDTSGVQIGDFLQVGSVFNPLNQGLWQVIAKSGSGSISVSNYGGVNEGPITIGSAANFNVFSAAGVQVGDSITISGGFSPVTQNTYKVTQVTANSLQFYSTAVLPQESSVLTQAIAIYSSAKQLIYLESDQNVSVIVNGSAAANILPFIIPAVIGSTTQPGVFMLKSNVYSLSLQNNSVNPANIFMASIE